MKTFLVENEFLRLSTTNFGATVLSLVVKNTKAGDIDVALGLTSKAHQKASHDYIGSTVGRCANRLDGACFELNGKKHKLTQNDGQNHLHGGACGFSFLDFDIEYHSSTKIKYSLLSPDGDQGYPADLDFSVEFCLNQNALEIFYTAKSSAETVLNPTSHIYFNLNGENDGSILDNLLRLNCDFFTPVKKDLIPTGKIQAVYGAFDFRAEKPIGSDIFSADQQLQIAGGYDHNFCTKDEFVGAAKSPKTGIKMEVFSDMCGVQFYSGNFLNNVKGKSLYNKHSGFCLETQFFPNAVNTPNFGSSPILAKDKVFKSTTRYVFF